MRTGEKEVIEIFYRNYYQLLFNYGLSMFPDKEFVRDAIQDLFVKLFSSEKLGPTPSVRSYLLKGLRYILFDKIKDIQELPLDDSFLFPDSEDASLIQLFEKNDEDLMLSKKLIRTYKELPENQRSAIYLRFIKGLSYKEIAQVMDIQVQSGMNLISRALNKIRKEFEK
ncbi:MAG: sigma-70 family RNA polymerase sigma factor [Tannerellaceae bacterium]|nr:sigma-70 family RNA polymerase sigma factor [Tannerellaceae bacterium]